VVYYERVCRSRNRGLTITIELRWSSHGVRSRKRVPDRRVEPLVCNVAGRGFFLFILLESIYEGARTRNYLWRWQLAGGK
jgi:hypothetical protein